MRPARYYVNQLDSSDDLRPFVGRLDEVVKAMDGVAIFKEKVPRGCVFTCIDGGEEPCPSTTPS